MTQYNANQSHAEAQQALKDKSYELDRESTEIQSAERLDNARAQLNGLKQAVAFIGTRGQP